MSSSDHRAVAWAVEVMEELQMVEYESSGYSQTL